MIPKECKRLAEVDFPIAKVGFAVLRREKKFPVPRGLPSTMHHWWARRPLGSCRAILLGLLLPDPCDPRCPSRFKAEAHRILSTIGGKQDQSDQALRDKLFSFIAEFANWNLSGNAQYMDVARRLVKAAHGAPPLVADTFAGGGAIPFEALRLGCEAHASDLNPVACLIEKVLVESIPRYGMELAELLDSHGASILEEARKAVDEYFPKRACGAQPMAYFWARTVRCESPNCGAEVPVFRSPWLSKKRSKDAAYFKEDRTGDCVAVVIDESPLGGPVKIRVSRGFGSPAPRSGYRQLSGTKAAGNNNNVICPCCRTTLSGNKKNPRVPTQIIEQRGGADVRFDENGNRIGGATLLAVMTQGRSGDRDFRDAEAQDYEAVWKAQKLYDRLKTRRLPSGHSYFPDERLNPTRPSPNARGVSAVTRYGMNTFGDLFTCRQKIVLMELSERIGRLYQTEDPKAVATAEILALAMDKVVDFNSSLTRWRASNEDIANVFGRQALPMIWDFVETNPLSSPYVDFGRAISHLREVVAHSARAAGMPGQVQIADARKPGLPEESIDVFFTDPPYYDAVPYADLSDFFLVWLKRSLPRHPLLRDPLDPSNPLSPKLPECVWNCSYKVDGRPKDPAFFERTVGDAFRQGRLLLREQGIGCVIFAHKTTEGWEALLSGLIEGGWVITSSWPIATEMSSRLLARETAALATSVHLICRPRPESAPVGDWANVLRELPKRVGDWMERLQSEGVRGADLVFACIGPALEIFSWYGRVETADGREVKLPGYLEKVWEVVGRTALEQVLGTAEAKARNGAAGAVEEDARLTALFLWTLQSTNGESAEAAGEEADGEEASGDEDEEEEETPSEGKTKGYSLVFDVVRRFAQPLGIDLPKWEGRIIETKKGVVRLFPVAERARILFGKDGAEAAVQRLEKAPAEAIRQLMLFSENEEEATAKGKGRGRGRRKAGADVPDEPLETSREATTLDRVHMAMLLQASGRANALRALLKGEQDRGPDFLRLANALSALYPKGSEEKRLLDAMLLAVPR
jgi:putative DNA methylase